MRVHGKNSRGSGKRGSSSSSSYVSMTNMLLVLACCVFAVYMLTSSITPPHATPASNKVSRRHHKRNAVPVPPRSILRDPPPAAEVHEDTQGHLPEDAVKGHHESISSSTFNHDSAGTQEDTPPSEIEAVRHEKQQQEDVETNPVDKSLHDEEVETRDRHDQSQSHDHEQQQHVQEERQLVQEDQPHEQQHEEINQNQSEEQQQDDAVNRQSNEEQQQQQLSSEQNNEQRDEEQSNSENPQRQQQQSETNGEEGHRDETNNNESLQENIHHEMDSNHGKDQPQIIQQVTEESNIRSEEGEGISSQSQMEHDTDGTTEHHQQLEQQQEQQQEQQEAEQQQQQQQEEQQQQQQQEEEDQEQQREQQQQDSLQPQQTEDEGSAGGSNENNQPNEDGLNVNDSLLDGDGGQTAVPEENKEDKKTWATQADQSSNEKERRKGEGSSQSNGRDDGGNGDAGKSSGQEWELCNVTAGSDYIPCLDNERAIKQLRSFSHFEHRERHCPEETPTCLVPLPTGYKRSIQWPQSRDRIWYDNVPRTKLAEVKGHQNWVKVTGEYLTFPGGGTQFIHGALHYIDFIQQSVPEIAWGKHTRVILDVGCGVASFGGYLFERDVLAMSFAPKDEHEAQVQFALERGIPAISAVMGSQRLPFPSRVFDIVHCARCRVPWHANDGALLLELNRVLRPGGFFVWSATPVYQKLKEDVEIWEAMTALTKSMCWELFTINKDKLNSIGAAMYRKPVTNDCYENRNEQKPPMCEEDDDPNAAWYVPLQSCMHRAPVDPSVRGSQWPVEWPRRAQVPPYWLNSSQMGVYGRPAPDDFTKDYEHWRRVVNKSYLNGFGIDWSKVRNVMDMRAVYGGFAAALKDMKVWVMNLVNIDSPDTLPIIYERGLLGMYHDWCESFSTYPRTYDLLHADHLFSQLRKRCKILAVVAEVDRITRPGGKLIVRDESDVVGEVENLLKSLHWEIRLTYSRNKEGILCAEKSDWRPQKISSSA